MLVRLPEWSFLTWGAFYQIHVSNEVKRGQYFVQVFLEASQASFGLGLDLPATRLRRRTNPESLY